ncbi:MAG: hypothetical protein ACKVY0_09645 [Prosthecobacter sp.]|uniref:hypothetical protein n=1 Tax=Prosthecobacter sp. TaxID=1965333 RepID=UPI0039001D73
MKKKPAAATVVESNVTDWIRELWEAEAKYTATVGSRLKFGLPLTPAKPRKRRKAVRKAAKV